MLEFALAVFDHGQVVGKQDVNGARRAGLYLVK
jgi:hypothetical protein